MVKIKKIGAFLTLGITFLSLLVLGIASLILKNAETSEERMVDMAGIDRLYNIDRSIALAMKDAITNTAGFNITINRTEINISKTTPGGASGAVSDINFTSYLTQKVFIKNYLKSLYNQSGMNVTQLEYDDFGGVGAQALGLSFDNGNVTYSYWSPCSGTQCPAGFTNTYIYYIIINNSDSFINYNISVSTLDGQIAPNWTCHNDFQAYPGITIPLISVYTTNMTGWVANESRYSMLSQAGDAPDPTTGSSGDGSECNGVISQKIVFLNTTNQATEKDPSYIKPFLFIQPINYDETNKVFHDAFIAMGTFMANLTVTFSFNTNVKTDIGLSSLDVVNISIKDLEIKKSGNIRIL